MTPLTTRPVRSKMRSAPIGSRIERQFQDMPNVPFKDEVWPKFLRENALRVFKIPEAIERATGKLFAG